MQKRIIQKKNKHEKTFNIQQIKFIKYFTAGITKMPAVFV